MRQETSISAPSYTFLFGQSVRLCLSYHSNEFIPYVVAQVTRYTYNSTKFDKIQGSFRDLDALM